ncbi:hypothetical protein [Cupriavidus taiwanensis]|uniref:hypothetical protein n=1 Tax=Cupriavidus taiwanensis TaxID=164546 RepID=UPI000E10959F|nr:hypothetical protein [Cupriavidus taiwanensis]SOY56850.1 conserved hypothetical protein [Cupriavidus taiwanensis]SOY90785.1 conserved hypothetical protein [Cupriavidus taiwanensis]SOZ63559.1 conserved hypothetical protein [Cupriavidus taiwanensis]SOZ82597.1 conserved hypothetical protein [Cupriavidus taiwanensis]SOZ84443.1 conserved hypothetical protein [Cupriavidus taiwanensis]
MSDNSFIHRDAFNLLCGDRIGYGMSRSVFSSRLLPDCVVKVEEDAGRFQNIVEWETWQRVQGTDVEKWFAPCRWISPNGSVLVMARTTPAIAYPEKMPVFLCDFKRTNYGLYDGRLVCHDYGTSLIFEHGMTKRMRKADWWDA